MLTIEPLFSGSSGNSVLVKSDENALLVDAGVSGRKIISALEKKQKSICDIDAILITHEHIDHIQSAGILSRRYHIPIYANEETWSAMISTIGDVPSELRRIIERDKRFDIGEISAFSFEIPHDAAAPVGYNFVREKKKVTVATDIGKMSERLFLSLSGSSEILLESNYDTVMLHKGAYPPPLKQRILGEKGHLSNKESATVCARLASLGTQKIILGHLSKENNTPKLAYDIARRYIENCGIRVGRDVQLSVAPRSLI